MAVDSILVHCGGCDERLAEDRHTPAEERTACPHCGSLLRRFDVNVSETLTLKSKLSAKGRHPGEKRPFIDQTIGDDLHRKTGRWMRLHRIINRVKDWYHEQVTDPATGEVVHECDEPLSDHRGHGSAKPGRRANGGVDA